MSDRVRAWLVVVAVVALLAGGVVFLRTGSEPRRRPEPGPLASPAVPAGTVGGLLPDMVLHSRYGQTAARQLRPAVILLTRPDCDCVGIARQVVADATPLGVVTYVVVKGRRVEDAVRVAGQAGGDAGAFADPAGVLANAYGVRSDAALVLVRRDGVVTQVVPAVAPTLQLRRAVRALLA